MNPTVEWIAVHALLLWALLLMLALLGGDLVWQHNARWHRRAARLGHTPVMMRWQVGVFLLLALVHYFSDVLAGYTAGAAWLVLCIGAAEILREPTTRILP